MISNITNINEFNINDHLLVKCSGLDYIMFEKIGNVCKKGKNTFELNNVIKLRGVNDVEEFCIYDKDIFKSTVYEFKKVSKVENPEYYL